MPELCERCGRPLLAPSLSKEARLTFEYMLRQAPRRGGYMFEGARPDFESGKYQDNEISELLNAGLIEPHADPAKGWIIAQSA
jgi:hypothetical protein